MGPGPTTWPENIAFLIGPLRSEIHDLPVADCPDLQARIIPSMSQTSTSSAQCTSPTPLSFNEDAWDFQARAAQQALVLAALPTVLQGVFTILCAASMYALIQRDGKARFPSITLALALLALFTSTTVYFVYTILSTRSSILSLLVYSAEALWSLPPAQVLAFPRAGLFKDYNGAQKCARTAALSVNILVGDAIVCWRACVLWQGSRSRATIKAICLAFLLATFGLGLVDIAHTCKPGTGAITSIHDVDTGFLYARFASGLAASALSFGTNFCATALVAYKALVSRRFVRKHAIAGALGVQTERVLALLVESGAFYCAVWAIVVVWQVGDYAAADASASNGDSSFWEVYGVVISGALVPIIAIYPTVIIILVALNKSHIEHGRFEREDGPASGPARMPLRTITVTGTIASVAEMQLEAGMREVDITELGVKREGAGSGSTVVGEASAEEPKVSQTSASSSSTFTPV